jgi:hypothetical protein
MSRLAVLPARSVVVGESQGSLVAAGSLGLVTLAALLAALAPVELSIAVVFAFAGPHNWMEARFVLSRLPPRWGRLRPFVYFTPSRSLRPARAPTDSATDSPSSRPTWRRSESPRSSMRRAPWHGSLDSRDSG